VESLKVQLITIQLL